LRFRLLELGLRQCSKAIRGERQRSIRGMFRLQDE